MPLLPADDAAAPSTWERVRFVLYVIAPWLALYEVTAKLNLHGTAFGLAFEKRLPILAWTAPLYQSIYLITFLVPCWVRSRRDLRRLTLSGWVSMAAVFPFYWLVPSSAPRRPLPLHSWVARILRMERTAFPPIAAFPSFHVLWAVFLARAVRPRWMGWSYVAIVAVSCITTGQHYIADVISALIIAPVFVEPERTWTMLRRLTGSRSETAAPPESVDK